jgi:hypothetical protein
MLAMLFAAWRRLISRPQNGVLLAIIGIDLRHTFRCPDLTRPSAEAEASGTNHCQVTVVEIHGMYIPNPAVKPLAVNAVAAARGSSPTITDPVAKLAYGFVAGTFAIAHTGTVNVPADAAAVQTKTPDAVFGISKFPPATITVALAVPLVVQSTASPCDRVTDCTELWFVHWITPAVGTLTLKAPTVPPGAFTVTAAGGLKNNGFVKFAVLLPPSSCW